MTAPTSLPTSAPSWTKSKPANTGAYYVRGIRRGEPDSRPALVEVELVEGKLVCNINKQNTDDAPAGWQEVGNLSPDFEWQGPLVLQKGNPDADQALRDGLYYGLLPDNLESHQNTWLQALERLIELEKPGVVGGPDDRAFWEHEHRAMLTMYADLQRLKLLQHKQPEGS